MGLYPAHALEYHLVLKNVQRIIIAGTRATDDRLLISQYYLKRKDRWFHENQARCDKINDDENVDIELNTSEKNNLANLIREHEDCVDHAGWYNVITVYDTYGL